MEKRLFSKPSWAVKQIVRRDAFAYGLLEDLCKHGVGHPNAEWLRGKENHWSVHGCDGCCGECLHDKEPERD